MTKVSGQDPIPTSSKLIWQTPKIEVLPLKDSLGAPSGDQESGLVGTLNVS